MFITDIEVKIMSQAIRVMKDAGLEVYGCHTTGHPSEWIVSAEDDFYMVYPHDREYRKVTDEEFTRYVAAGGKNA